jgi:hypothetical protein
VLRRRLEEMFSSALRLFSLLPLLSFSLVLGGGTLKLNSVEGSVVIPSGANDYALLEEAGSLFVAWTERSSSDWGVVLAKVNVNKYEVNELFREAFDERRPSSPKLALHDDQLVMTWLLKTGNGPRMTYEIEAISFDFSTGKKGEKNSLSYGYQPRGLQLLSSPCGLFVGGASSPGRREGMRLYFYGMRPQGWVPLEIPGSEGSYNQYPHLAGGEKYLYLAWVNDGKLNFARSANGEAWDDLQVLSGKGAGNPWLFLGENDYLGVVWSEETGHKGMQVRLATSPDHGLTWWHASEPLEVEGTRLEFDFCFNRDSKSLVVYHFWSADKSCEMIESCIMSSDWRRARLDRFPDAVCGRSLNPATLVSENRAYVVWQERRGRRTSIAVNYSEYPWDDWLKVPSQLVEGERDEVVAGPKLVSSENRLFLTYFTYGAKRGLFQRNLQLGDLLLRELDVNHAASGRLSIR